MKKIKTIFERDWDGNHGVINKQLIDVTGLIPTEKIDGTNVRLTVRNHILVRLEKRRLPTKLEKAKGVVDPWYVDADEFAPNDKYIWEAARNTDLSNVKDGEYSGEAYGEKIQGNPLEIKGHTVFLFSEPNVLNNAIIADVPAVDYESIKKYLQESKSTINPNKKIEGIVWWHIDGHPVAKIKLKDFK